MLLQLLILASMFPTASTPLEASYSADREFAEVVQHFEEFVQHYGREYKTRADYIHAFDSYRINYEMVRAHNINPDREFDMEMNKFSDKSHYEFWTKRRIATEPTVPNRKNPSHRSDDSKLPSQVDWRASGLVTDVKNQMECGSCWAFSAVAAMEGQHAKKTGKLVSLSEQNLVDCAEHFGCYGCEGGWMSEAMEYVEWNHGIDTEESYPYKGVDDKCSFNKSHVGATVKGVMNITEGSVSDLLHAVATVGPISVAVDASSSDFQFYSSGIYTSKSCSAERLDHGVTVVGYGETNEGKKYYIVKNSWGKDWGMDGYVYWNRDIPNMCGIAQKAAYPLV